MEPLIAVEQLDLLKEGNGLTILDARDQQSFTDGHIPGAANLDWEDLIDPNHEIYGMIANPEQFASVINTRNLQPSDPIVIYDDQGGVEAARVWWVLKNYGFAEISILDGGLTKWERSGFKLESGPGVSSKRGDRQFGFEAFRIASKEMVLEKLDDPDFTILDVRSVEEYTGEKIKSGAARGGRIRGAVLVDYILNFDLDENMNVKGFKDPSALKYLYEEKGIKSDQKLIVYCHTAVRSSLTTFVLTELLGYQEVYNYDGSWREWSHMDSTLIETH